MVPKVISKRSDGRSSFRTLLEYITRHDADRELGDIKQELDTIERELVALARADGLGMLPRVEATDGPSRPDEAMPAVETNCLSVRTASAEMKAVSDMNGRVKDPVYHCVLSWRGGERPTDPQMFEAGREAMRSIGMEGHQYVFAAHRDTNNHHLHMMVNRVDPETERAVYPDRDFFHLDRCMRELELKQGWQHDNGAFAVFERDGKKVIDWSSTAINTKEKRPSKARDMEEVRGQESLFSYARGEPRQAVAELLKDTSATWQELHGVLAKHGLELREKGQGLAIYDKDNPEQTPVKASDVHEALGKGKLVKRLGEYEPPIRAIQVEEPAKVYTKQREPVRDQVKRDQAREERAQARQQLRGQYDDWAKSQRQTLSLDKAVVRLANQQKQKDLAAYHKARRDQIKVSGLPTLTKKALYSVAAMEAVQAREALKTRLAEQRNAERLMRPQSFREWTADRAQEGDQAAISQVRGWAYAERRSAKEMGKADQTQSMQDGITFGGPAQRIGPLSPRCLTLLDSLQYQVDRKTGDVHYQTKDRHVFTDSGQRVTFSAAGVVDQEALAAGLLLAREKFGQQITLTGSDHFKDAAIRIMVERRLDIRLADPVLEAKRLVLASARDLSKPRHDLGKNLVKTVDSPSMGPSSGRE
jgi:hypothetical protein